MKFDKRQRGSVESIFDDLDTELAASVFYDDLKRDVSSYSADEDSLIILVDASLSGFVRLVGSRTMVRLFPFDIDDWPEPEDPGPEG